VLQPPTMLRPSPVEPLQISIVFIQPAMMGHVRGSELTEHWAKKEVLRELWLAVEPQSTDEMPDDGGVQQLRGRWLAGWQEGLWLDVALTWAGRPILRLSEERDFSLSSLLILPSYRQTESWERREWERSRQIFCVMCLSNIWFDCFTCDKTECWPSLTIFIYMPGDLTGQLSI